MGFGGVGWTTPSNMAKYGTIYSYDYNQNAFFPAGLSATSLSEGGTKLVDKYLGKGGKAADSDKLDGQHGSYYLDYKNFTNKPTATKSATTGITVSAALAANPSFTGTSHTHTVTDNGHTHTYDKAKVTGTTDVVKSASFAATYDANNHRRSFGFTAANTKVLTGIGYDSVATGKATTGIAVGSTTAGGTVSKPNINVTVTDQGHTHGI